ncbi:beta-galactosidase [Kribbella orskensis]|uniref:beta-galactosidase n=1 Tax=Kribbella orskensis TaxID=2512216 RepID=A0ABY2BE41_9ACTN|nr:MULTISPECIES: beta-galactosidase [Kribbella]TCN35500.1 beta-galactosidase [Kribbella sp. VKM Ac-2500]TCO17042.1 beta-galactosidase [Kribbella orskensis]
MHERVLFGGAYYHEYQPQDRLEQDLDQMAAAHFSVIRVGESVWSTWEPENGRFELDWLQPVLDGAHERDIAVLLGTPTYAVPPWLARLYPEITGERRTGQRIGWGARQEVDFTHPGFRFHAERVIRRIAERYAGHPAVIGFQVDNEPGNELLHNRGVFQRFVDSLRHRYGDVQTLNDEWGLVYWSHRLSDWADLWTPDGNVQPQYDVAWRQFQADQTTEFIGWQADIVREYARPDQFVTTCIAYERPALADDELVRRLDVTTGNAYYATQEGLSHPQAGPAQQGWTTSGTWALYLSADRMYSSQQRPFLVTETNAQSIGYPWNNRPAYDGQWRQAAWALVSRGASMIEYWHWHTLHFGAETYWGGVLPHSGRPGRTYREIARLGAELEAAGSVVAGLTPDSDVTMLYSMPSKWLMQKYPALAHEDGSPDERSYNGFFDPFYRGAFDAGLQVRIVHASQFTGSVENQPVLVVPALYLANNELLDQLVAYAEAGGHLVVGPRTGYADREARARTDIQPARLATAAGVWYDEYSNLSVNLSVRGSETGGLELGDDAAATRWVDGLQLDGADVLAGYDHPHFAQWPAITTRAHGSGRITYVGTVPNPALAAALFRWIRPVSLTDLPSSVTVTSATAADGRRVRFVHNWSWDDHSLDLPAPVHDVLSDEPVNGKLELGPWDVRVLVESDQ